MRLPETDDEYIACHEVGHALIAILCGENLQAIQFEKNSNIGLARALIQRASDPQIRAKIACGGIAAEIFLHLIHKPNVNPHALLRSLRKSGSSDFKVFQICKPNLNFINFFVEAEEIAKKTFPNYRDQLSVAVDELIKKRMIYGYEFIYIIKHSKKMPFIQLILHKFKMSSKYTRFAI